MKYCIVIFFLFLTTQAQSQDCSCLANFSYMIGKVKKNYAGYYDKVTVANQQKFDLFTDSLLAVAQKSDKYQCSSILREWLAFFKDKHMTAGIDATGFSDDAIRQFYAKDIKASFTETQFYQYLENNKEKKDDIEGVWFNDTGTYKIAIIRDPNQNLLSFLAFVIKADSIYWAPGQIKFEIVKEGQKYQTKYFRSKDHSYMYPIIKREGDTLSFDTYGKWYKNKEIKSSQTITKKKADLSPKFTKIGNGISMFSLPSFASLEYVKVMDSLIKQNEAILKSTKHLIIDLRDNSGGSVLVYEKLLPYLYTNPILTEGGTVLASSDNIENGYSNLHPELSDSLQRYFKERLSKLKAHEGEFYKLYPIDTIKLPVVEKYPERISFLVNRNTGSAAELFLLEAKQSKKVKIYGENSAGAVDYTEFIKVKMPCDFFVLYYPACKSLRLPEYPLDNIGIQPDIKIPGNITDWIDYVQTHTP